MTKFLMFELKFFKNDVIAGFFVFLVSLPLSLGIALASDAPLFSGIIAGIIGGILITSISKSALGVSGPAAGLAVIVAQSISSMGYETFLLAVMVAGIIQIVAGFMRLWIISHYLPLPVIKGLLAGIGLVLILKQIPHAVGYDTSWMGEIEFIESGGGNTLIELINMLSNLEPWAVIIFVISLIILLTWDRPFIRNISGLKLIPAPLLVVIFGVLINVFYKYITSELYLSGNHLGNIPVATSLRVVGYKLTRISLYKEMYKKGRWRFIPFIVTIIALVFTDMLTGVMLGLAVGFFPYSFA